MPPEDLKQKIGDLKKRLVSETATWRFCKDPLENIQEHKMVSPFYLQKELQTKSPSLGKTSEEVVTPARRHTNLNILVMGNISLS